MVDIDPLTGLTKELLAMEEIVRENNQLLFVLKNADMEN